MDKQTDNREETAQTISKIAETKQMNSQYMQENRENRRKGGRQAGGLESPRPPPAQGEGGGGPRGGRRPAALRHPAHHHRRRESDVGFRAAPVRACHRRGIIDASTIDATA